MKICIITTAFPGWPGDVRAPFIYEAAQALRNFGIEIRVFAMHRPGTKTHEFFGDIEIFRTRYLPERWEILQEESGGLPIVWQKKPLAKLAIIGYVICQSITILRYARKYDIIHANWTLSGMISRIICVFLRRPYIVTVHGSDIYQGIKARWIRSITKICLKDANAVIAVSRDLANCLNQLGIPKNLIFVIPDGIDTEKFSPTSYERKNYILFVGSLIPRKGCKFLIRAFQKVIEVHTDYQLFIVGEGPDANELRILVSDLDIHKKVHFLGTMSREEVSRLMRQARIFVLPSLEEGLGVVLLEAIASGTPCVASCVGGIPDIITAEVGILVNPGDPFSLASAIIRILDDPKLWNEFSRASRNRAVNLFSWEIVASQITDLYLRILSNPEIKT